MLGRVLNFFFVRGLAIVIGAVLYVYCAIQQAAFLRTIQRGARWIADMLEAYLPDHWAVWLPALNLETSLAFAVFLIAAYMIVEIVERLMTFGANTMRGR